MAKEYLDFLASSFPGVETATNPSKPRRGAFNITILTSGGLEHEVWDGKSKGPPRKEKFPDKDQVLASIRARLAPSSAAA